MKGGRGEEGGREGGRRGGLLVRRCSPPSLRGDGRGSEADAEERTYHKTKI